jgi:hypothetical protein
VKLPCVVDLEVQLALDEGQDEAALRARDRAIYLQMASPPPPGPALLSAWLEALRTRFGEPRVGERVETAQRILAYALTFTGITSGWGVAELLLHFEQGGAPINVGHYLLVLVIGQLATLALLALGLLLRGLWGEQAPRLPLLGDVARLLRFVSNRLQRQLRDHHSATGERLDADWAAYQRIRTRLGLYQRLERSLLLRQSQLFAVCFNLGALACCVRLILLSDLAFAWSTSMASLDAAQLQRVCALLSWPFGWLVPEAIPTPALIEHTQYFRLEGRYAGAASGTRGSPALAAQWWQFLVACTVSYGLVPRLLAYALFARQFRRAERNVPLDTPAVQRVLTRLVTPALSTRAPALIAQSAEPALSAASAPLAVSGPSALVLYRDIPTDGALLARALAEHLGLQVSELHRAGGLDVQEDARLCAALGQASASVIVVAEAWEAPDKSLRQLLSALRRSLGTQRALRVVLIGEARADGFAAPSEEDVRVYRDRLTLLQDPYLLVETLPALQPRSGVEVHS